MIAPGALDGIRVLDFTQMKMGPLATQMLGDLGADVVKVERVGRGDWERGLASRGELLDGDGAFFLAMNRNKRSVALDLKDERAQEVVRRLARDADVVVENFRPGTLDGLGLGYDELAAANPRLLYVSGSGFGPTGPYRERPGQDLLIQALSGLAALGGRAGEEPVPAGSSVVDAAAGFVLAFATVAGLLHRERTGEGQRIHVDLLSTALAMLCEEVSAVCNLGQVPERSPSGIAAPLLDAPYGVYRTADGHIVIAMADLTVLAGAVDVPELARHAGREFAERDAVRGLLQAALAARPSAEWLERLERAGVWSAPVQGVEAAVDDPQVRHRGLLVDLDHPTKGRLRVVGAPATFEGTPATVRRPPPRVGEHTREVLAEAGYDRAAIDALVASGAAGDGA